MNINDLPAEYQLKLKKRIEAHYIITGKGCWEWTMAKAHAGHGRMSVMHKYNRVVHRVYWELLYGPVPKNRVLDHFICDNPPCINPAHLKMVSHWENTFRGTNPIAMNTRKTHCKFGHPFNEQNTRYHVNPQGGRKNRACITCARAKCHKQDIARTQRYRAQGLNSKGKPMSQAWKKKYDILEVT